MKKFALILLVLFSPLVTASAENVTLSWDPSPTPDVAGYKVYYKENSPSLPFDGVGLAEGPSPVDVGNQLSATLTGLPENSTFFFAVTAYDAAGYESSYSNLTVKNRSHL